MASKKLFKFNPSVLLCLFFRHFSVFLSPRSAAMRLKKTCPVHEVSGSLNWDKNLTFIASSDILKRLH